eukprot:8025900-Pyramimonas_sp.AAC.1
MSSNSTQTRCHSTFDGTQLTRNNIARRRPGGGSGGVAMETLETNGKPFDLDITVQMDEANELSGLVNFAVFMFMIFIVGFAKACLALVHAVPDNPKIVTMLAHPVWQPLIVLVICSPLLPRLAPFWHRKVWEKILQRGSSHNTE